MSNSIHERLKQDLQCEGLLECFYGLTQLDKEVFKTISVAEEPVTIDKIAEQINRERTTAYRSVQRLLDAGFVDKTQINYENGGYHHVYYARHPEEITNELQRMLNDWYAKMGQLIREFETKYDQEVHSPDDFSNR